MINKLVDKIKKTNAPIVVGLDPMLSYVPEHIQKAAFAEFGETPAGAAEAIWQYNKAIVDATYDLIPAVKPQIAMYEQFGVEGVKAFQKTVDYCHEKDLVVIGDVDEGAEITAAGNIIVTGVLNGLASAGQPGNSECFIYAGLIKSTTLIIGEQEGELPPKKGFFKDKKKDGGDVLLFRKDHFIITNIQDEIFMNYPNKKKG